MRYLVLIGAIFSLSQAAYPADDLFSLSPPHSIGATASGDSAGGRAGSLNFSATLPGDWTAFGSFGRQRNEFDGESAQLRHTTVGFASDQLNTYFFELTVDEASHSSLFSDAGAEIKLVYQPINGLFESWSFGLKIGARRFRFKPQPGTLTSDDDRSFSSSSAGFLVDWSVTKKWDLHFEANRHSYPEQIRDFDSDAAPVSVPNDTLDYVFGLPQTSGRIEVGFRPDLMRRHQPRVSLALGSSKSAVDDSTSGFSDLALRLKLNRSLHLSIGLGASRSVVNAKSNETVRNVNTALTYSWR